MFVYLMQHGEAKPEQEDPARPLSDRGRDAVQRVGACVARAGMLRPQALYHSPKARAAQTARIVGDVLEPPPRIEEADGLLPRDDPWAWAGRLRQTQEDCLLVGHLPHLAKLAGLLIAGRPDLPVVDFTMGGMVCLRRGEGGGFAVAWMVVPDMVP